ncbi:MAG: hypothetical protein AMXMBFR53_05560 [Gemmatimonadota bacterium]
MENVPVPQPLPDRLTGGSTDRLLSGLFRESPLPMLLVDVRSRRITRVNHALNRLLGFDAGELEGRALRELDTGDSTDLEEHLLLAVACGDDQPRERRWHGADGDAVPVELRAARLHGDQGTILALYVRDLRVDEKEDEVEAAAERANARQLLARKHEAVGRLASGLAREFGAVLDHIARTAEDLRGTGASPGPEAGSLESLLEAGEKARRLVAELLAFTGQQQTEARTVSLNQVVLDTEESLRDLLPHDIGLMVRPGPETGGVSADPVHLQEILARLVERARVAMPDGGYVVVATEEVELDADFVAQHPSTQPGPHAVLTVTDTGTALDEEAQSRIFEPFFSSQEMGQGSGLGLATAYGLVKRNGGTIWVTSRPGMGTTFRVYLPRVGGSTAPAA